MLHGGKYTLGTFVMVGILTPVIFFHSADARVPKKGGEGMHVVKIVDPSTVGDLMRPGSDDATSGLAIHQRAISKPRDGSIFLDVGINHYAAGVGGERRYAYSRDELCYMPTGEAEVRSDGVSVIARPGIFMWRPAGAPTEYVGILKGGMTVCAFGPARNDEWSHLIASNEIGKWEGSERTRPHVHFYHVSAINPVEKEENADYQQGRIVERRVVSAKKDGAVHIDATHWTLTAGVILKLPGSKAGEQICWLESGELEIASNSRIQQLNKGQIMFRPIGVSLDFIRAREDSVAICFSGPAMK